MPVKGIDQVNRRIKSTLENIDSVVTRKVITEVLMTGQNHAVILTPVDTSNLINSRFLQIKNVGYGFTGQAGYTANYAKFVHDGGPKNWQKIGAEDQFLYKGFEENMPELRQIIIDGYKI
ncbi:hypothetical protein [uncultured Alteromonas sp.]|uniref:hypothetical protein n=1 Tax=uncultured Alteromonas sp. TaxID=179113 RepID=UPI0030EDC46A|tara:strand:- start:2756 stop:3115 length:360 start_codon:yes stop_codon:yes gene_type:complete